MAINISVLSMHGTLNYHSIKNETMWQEDKTSSTICWPLSIRSSIEEREKKLIALSYWGQYTVGSLYFMIVHYIKHSCKIKIKSEKVNNKIADSEAL